MWHTSNIPLCNLDHVDSAIFTEFSSVWAKWLPFSKLVMHHSLFLMFSHYHHDFGGAISLEPLLQFGNLSVYHTRTKSCFAHTVRCCLSFTQSFFHHRAAQYWNSLPTDINKDHVQFSDFKIKLIFCLCCDLCFCIIL